MTRERIERLVNNSAEKFFKENNPGLDNDGVIRDTRTLVLDFVNCELKTGYRDVDIRHWHAVRQWALESGWPQQRAIDLENYVWFDPSFLMQAEVLPGAEKFTSKLVDLKIPFKVITSRRPQLIKSTYEWYEEKLPKIPRQNISIWPTVEMKGGILKSFNINMFNLGAMFEDVPEQAMDIASNTDAYIFLLSNIGRFDGMFRDRLFRVSGENGSCANLNFVAAIL